jgi:NAD(P)-dependent dehydrogenase (short-subunit alcohol dehydrogenase family)
MKTFQNKTVLITGGTSGIGKATALAFAKEGANVVVSGRRVAEGEEVAREITSAGGSALFVQTDVARELRAKNFANLSGQGLWRERLLQEGHFGLYNAVTHYRIVDITALEEQL